MARDPWSPEEIETEAAEAVADYLRAGFSPAEIVTSARTEFVREIGRGTVGSVRMFRAVGKFAAYARFAEFAVTGEDPDGPPSGYVRD